MPTVIPTSNQNSLLTDRTANNPIDAIYNQGEANLTGTVKNTNLNLSKLVDANRFILDPSAYPNLSGDAGKAQLEAIQRQVDNSLQYSQNQKQKLSNQYDEARVQRLQQNQDAMSITQQLFSTVGGINPLQSGRNIAALTGSQAQVSQDLQKMYQDAQSQLSDVNLQEQQIMSEGYQQAADLQLAQQSFDRGILEGDRNYEMNKSTQLINASGELVDYEGNPWYEGAEGGITMDKKKARIGDDGKPVIALSLSNKAAQAAATGAAMLADIDADLTEGSYLRTNDKGEIVFDVSEYNGNQGFNPKRTQNTIEAEGSTFKIDNEIYQDIDKSIESGNTSTNPRLDKIFMETEDGQSSVFVSTKSGADSTGYLLYEVESSEEGTVEEQVYYEIEEDGTFKILSKQDGISKGANKLTVASMIEQIPTNDRQLVEVLNKIATTAGYEGLVKKLITADEILGSMSGINDRNKLRSLAVMADREGVGLSFFADKDGNITHDNRLVSEDMMKPGDVLSENSRNNMKWMAANEHGENLSEIDRYSIAYLMDTIGGDDDAENRYYAAKEAYLKIEGGLTGKKGEVIKIKYNGKDKEISPSENLAYLRNILSLKENILKDTALKGDGAEYFNAIAAGLFTTEGFRSDKKVADIEFIKALNSYGNNTKEAIEKREKKGKTELRKRAAQIKEKTENSGANKSTIGSEAGSWGKF